MFDKNASDELGRLPAPERTERMLHLLLEPWFLGYWTFPNPKEKGIEFADVLTWWGDVAFLFEAKTRLTGASDLKWPQRKLVEAINQINARAEQLRAGTLATLTNRWRGQVAWEPSRVAHYYGIVILNHISDPYDPWGLAKDALLASEVPIQVFSLQDAAQLFRVVDTIPDFLCYYELRADYSRTAPTYVHKEYQTYEGILDAVPDLMSPQIGKHMARSYQRFMRAMRRAILVPQEALKNDLMQAAASQLVWVGFSSTIVEAPFDHQGRRCSDSVHDYRVEALAAFAELSAQRRAHWGSRWVESARSALRSRTDRHSLGYSPERNCSYVFAATKLEGPDREDLIRSLLSRAIKLNSTSSAVCLAADPDRILWTYDWIKLVLRRPATAELGREKIVDSSVGYASVPPDQ